MIISDGNSIGELLKSTKTIAVLGIKTEAAADQPAYYVPKYAQERGFEIIPVPIYYPEATEILGQKVYRKLSELPGPVDMVNVFRRSKDLKTHVEDILLAKPKSVWLQLGIRDDDFAKQLSDAGITVVQDRCLLVELRARP